jgi:hypothetical protein
MAEELFQDGVKQVASAYGALINNANEAGKGRYLQYLMMVILKMLQSVTLEFSYRWTMGMIGHKVDLSPLHLQVLIYLWTVEKSFFPY